MATSSRQAREIASLRHELEDVEARLAERDAAWRQQIEQVAARLDEHEARLNDVPSTGQIVSAMEELLSKTMQSLNHRLSAQADSIELLKTTVSQTDGLLERVLESLDSLRQNPPAEAE
jgi:chromosome segregation ATPase